MFIILGLSSLIFILDQLTKFWVRNTFSLGQSRPLLPGIFHLTFVTNTGSAFGLFPGARSLFIILSILTLLVLLTLAWRKRRKLSLLVQFSFGLLLGGVAGNLIDRLRFGYVIDFLDFRIWPAFNIADSSITLGVIFLSYHLLIRNRKPSEALANASHTF